MTAQELDKIYCRWTWDLHTWVLAYLGRYISARYYPPPDWKMELFTGIPQEHVSSGGIPRLEPPEGAEVASFKLPRPEHQPTQADVDKAFRGLCLAAALLLHVDIAKTKLANGSPPASIPSLGAPDES
jgi:hypothetical protein